MTNVRLIINDLVLKKNCATRVEAFYDPFAEFYLLPVLQFKNLRIQPLINNATQWSNHTVDIGYNNTRQFGRKDYHFQATSSFELHLYLIQQPSHLHNSWQNIQHFFEEKEKAAIENIEESYLLSSIKVELKKSIQPINLLVDNELLKGNFQIIKKGHQMILPPKRFPTAFAAWSVFEASRPYFLEPVGFIQEQPPGINPKVVSSVDGKIKTLVLFYPSMQEAGEKRIYQYSNFLLELIGCMKGAGRQFIVAVENHYSLPPDLENKLKKIAEQVGHTLEIIAIDYSQRTLSPWVQDAFLPIQFEKEGRVQTFLVESTINYHYTESANALTSAYTGINEFRYYESSLPFVGGNVLAGDDFLLIGLHYSNKESLAKIGASWLGKNYIMLSSSPTPYIQEWGKTLRTSDGVYNYYEASTKDQILFHLDLFITLAGKGLRRNTIEYIVVGEPVIGFEGLEGAPVDVQVMVHQLISETALAIEEIIGQIKEGMEGLGKRYKIVRIPLPLTYYDQKELQDEQHTRTRYWCWASYSNCLVERYKEENNQEIRRVFLPSYGQNSDYAQYSKNQEKQYGSWKDLEKFDDQSKTLWEEELDYEVVLLQQDFNPFIRYQGSLNCLTNCIERTL
ncbi:MAG: hypothetical protein ACRBFS_01710 [Aureispira sp.]